jgi:hypothetical protein
MSSIISLPWLLFTAWMKMRFKHFGVLAVLCVSFSTGICQTTVTITGAEQSTSGEEWDSGQVAVTVAGTSKTVSFGQFSTATSIATDIAAQSWPGSGTSYSNQNVMNSTTVNSSVLCWLVALGQCANVASPGSGLAANAQMRALSNNAQGISLVASSQADDSVPKTIKLQQATPSKSSSTASPAPAPAISPAEASRRAEEHRRIVAKGHRLPDANDRVNVIVPSSPLVLGQPYDLALNIKNGGLTQVSVVQKVQHQSEVEIVRGSDQALPVLHRANGDAYISITPLGLGTVEIGLVGSFSDGGILHQRISVYVEEPSTRPTKLTIGDGFSPYGSVHVIRMRLENPIGNALVVKASYEGLKTPVKIDPNFARFTVNTGGKGDVISLDPRTGIIWPLNVGHALVETSYGGLTTRTCVAVVGTQAQIEREHSQCSELLAPGERLP